MEHHGTARVSLVNEKMPLRRSTMSIEAADVSRPLQSVGVTCDHGKEVLFTKEGCFVVPEGSFAPLLRLEDISQAFKREPGGGLYTRSVTVSLPDDTTQAPVPASGPASSFRRPGMQ